MQGDARARLRRILGSAGVTLGMTCATLLGLEVFLRVCDFRELRQDSTERSLGYGYDAELGWAPVPNSTSEVTNYRTIHVRHNSIGLRDEEFVGDGKPVIIFLGDSFVWGLDSEAEERFSDLLKAKLPNYRIVAAGVSGFGNDQEYLLLRRLWPKLKPSVVMLIFCSDNDRLDNATNIRYEDYQKPYFTVAADGRLELHAQPVPLSRQQYFKEVWWARNIWLARLGVLAWIKIVHPVRFFPDPTEKLVGTIREFVEGNGGKFLVGIQRRDEALARYLERSGIPFVSLDGAAFYVNDKVGGHWNPEGQAFVAERIFKLLAENNIVPR
jgi:hypothetical protein